MLLVHGYLSPELSTVVCPTLTNRDSERLTSRSVPQSAKRGCHRWGGLDRPSRQIGVAKTIRTDGSTRGISHAPFTRRRARHRTPLHFSLSLAQGLLGQRKKANNVKGIQHFEAPISLYPGRSGRNKQTRQSDCQIWELP